MTRVRAPFRRRSGAKIGREGLGGDRGSSSRQSAAVWVGSVLCRVSRGTAHFSAPTSRNLFANTFGISRVWPLFFHGVTAGLALSAAARARDGNVFHAHMLEGAASLMRSGKTARKPSRCHCTSNEAISRITSASAAKLWRLVHGKRLRAQSKDQHNTSLENPNTIAKDYNKHTTIV